MHRSRCQAIKNFILDAIFPKFCLSCKKEGSYLCQDCQALLEVLEYRFCLCKKAVRLPEGVRCGRCSRNRRLNGLYFALPYQNNFAKILIHQFKYEPFVKDLAKTITSLIIDHFHLLEKKKDDFADFLLVPVPLTKQRLKWRGFNQAEEIGKGLADFLEIPLVTNILLKTKATLPQIDLAEKARMENIKGAFSINDEGEIKGRKILLIDDVYTTGATLEECARILKESGAKEVWGVVAARG